MILLFLNTFIFKICMCYRTELLVEKHMPKNMLNITDISVTTPNTNIFILYKITVVMYFYMNM